MINGFENLFLLHLLHKLLRDILGISVADGHLSFLQHSQYSVLDVSKENV